MANINIVTTAEQDAAVQRAATEYNRDQRMANPQWVDLGPVAYFKKFFVEGPLDALVARFGDRDRVTKIEAYQKATPEDKTAVDTILAKYQ